MTLLDAYALVAFLVGGPAAAAVRTLLRAGNTAVATTNLVESLDVSQRRYELPIPRALELLEPLFDVALAPRALDVSTACRAASIRAEYYHRSSCPISLGDAVLLASAGDGERVATADPAVLDLAERLGIGTVVLASQS